MIELTRFCNETMTDFTPLGGSRPDGAVAACAAATLYTASFPTDANALPWDVLDTALAALCSPLVVNFLSDLQGQEALFRCPAVSVRLRTIDPDVLLWLRMNIRAGARLFVALELDRSMSTNVTIPESFMSGCRSIAHLDLRRTSVQKVGSHFLFISRSLTSIQLPGTLRDVSNRFLAGCHRLKHVDLRHTSIQTAGSQFLAHCRNLSAVELPESLTEVYEGFLAGCDTLQRVDLHHTALQKIGTRFADGCTRLLTVSLPDSVTEVGESFLKDCDPCVHVVTNSTAVLTAASQRVVAANK